MIKKPFVFLCTGVSLDGKISNYKRECSPISADDNRDLLYNSRVNADAVMIGGKTLIHDDSGLTVKSESRQQQRLKLGKTKEPAKLAIISDASQIKMGGDFLSKGDGQKYIFTTQRTSQEIIDLLSKAGCQCFVYGENKVDLKKVMLKIVDLGIESVLVEGGGELIFSLIKEKLVDEIYMKLGDLIIGGADSPTLADGQGFELGEFVKTELLNVERQGNVMILRYKIIK